MEEWKEVLLGEKNLYNLINHTMETNVVFINGIPLKFCRKEVFQWNWMFESYNKAVKYLNDNWISFWSMQMHYPIAIVKNGENDYWETIVHGGKIRVLLPKWKYISDDDIEHLDGIIKPRDNFRDGDTEIYFFN